MEAPTEQHTAPPIMPLDNAQGMDINDYVRWYINQTGDELQDFLLKEYRTRRPMTPEQERDAYGIWCEGMRYLEHPRPTKNEFRAAVALFMPDAPCEEVDPFIKVMSYRYMRYMEVAPTRPQEEE